jgi:serine protease inhibitor
MHLYVQSSEKVVLEIANRMYLKFGFTVEKEFSDAAEKTFNSSVESVNFEDPEVRKGINAWVEKTTHDKIKNLIPEGIWNSLTKSICQGCS